MDSTSLLQLDAERTVTYLRALLDAQTSVPAKLKEAIAYSLFSGGKRLRPTLVLESARTCGGAEDDETALAAAAAIELIHTFSLVHDDLPAMDDDDLRRGRPTNHKVFGEAMAILAGDAMVTLAFETLMQVSDPTIATQFVREISAAAGPGGMIGGQALDIVSENIPLPLEQLQRIHRMKSAALLTAACRMGAISASANEAQLSALTHYGENLGLAFQIVDDVLDVTTTPEQLGKATRKDAGKGKNTYPVLVGLEQSRKMAQEHVDAAIDALLPFRSSAESLRQIARFVMERKT